MNCEICGKWSESLERHHIFEGRGRRQLSEEDGAVIHICRSCHRDIHDHGKKYLWLKEYWQKLLMKKNGWTTENFIERYGRNYIDGDI